MPTIGFIAFILMLCTWIMVVACRLCQASQDAEHRRTNTEIWLRQKKPEDPEKQRQHEGRREATPP
jgi:hypothetical protein